MIGLAKYSGVLVLLGLLVRLELDLELPQEGQAQVGELVEARSVAVQELGLGSEAPVVRMRLVFGP